MFTGIIEALGTVIQTDKKANGNLDLTIEVPFATELIIGQSIAHNGVCLTVTDIDTANKTYKVTAIEETLKLTNLGFLQVRDLVNLERCMLASGRYDGHIVQGHVDTMAACKDISTFEGSWIYQFEHDIVPGNMTVLKGSVCVNGISLTVAASEKDNFSVAIIPHTHTHTNIQYVEKGVKVNVEFDIIGKYLYKMNQNIN